MAAIVGSSEATVSRWETWLEVRAARLVVEPTPPMSSPGITAHGSLPKASSSPSTASASSIAISFASSPAATSLATQSLTSSEVSASPRLGRWARGGGGVVRRCATPPLVSFSSIHASASTRMSTRESAGRSPVSLAKLRICSSASWLGSRVSSVCGSVASISRARLSRISSITSGTVMSTSAFSASRRVPLISGPLSTTA
mmetsp:Transcript_68929/g.136665  ORF Transcript_68929/g.136665 Transcript_68929/m.136665 type:complete len:201 (-) Transcript_68929:83-685(-)